MNKYFFATIAAGLLMSFAALQAQAQTVCFYENAGFQGRSFCLEDGQGIDDLGYNGFNDRISSIYINGFVDVTVCQNSFKSGPCRIYTSSVRNLKHQGFNDNISSIQIGYYDGWNDPYPEPYPQPIPPSPQPGRTCVYKHADMQGSSICLRRGQTIRNLANTGLNDEISSIIIPSGIRVLLCEHADFGGGCYTFQRDNNNFANFGFNDMVSSIRVY